MAKLIGRVRFSVRDATDRITHYMAYSDQSKTVESEVHVVNMNPGHNHA